MQNGKDERNIVNRIQIVITPSCNFHSFVQLKYKFCKRISTFIGEKMLLILRSFLHCLWTLLQRRVIVLRNFNEKKYVAIGIVVRTLTMTNTMLNM